MKAKRADEWAEAKRRCRLSDEALQMAKELGFGPRGLIKNIPAKTERWKLPVEAWVREQHRKRFGERRRGEIAGRAGQSPAFRQEPARPSAKPLREAEESLRKKFENDAIDTETFAFELDELEANVPISAGEIEEQNQHALKRQLAFREAAYAVAAALAKISAVRKVMLFGSVATALRKEVPRFRRLRRTGIEIFHECKDVDLAVWVNDFADLRALKKAAARALNEWHSLHPNLPGVAHHQVDIFLLDASSNEFRGNLCHYGECPKGKPECAVPGCGAAPFVQIRSHMNFRPDALAAGVMLFDRATGLFHCSGTEDEIPF